MTVAWFRQGRLVHSSYDLDSLCKHWLTKDGKMGNWKSSWWNKRRLDRAGHEPTRNKEHIEVRHGSSMDAKGTDCAGFS